MAQIYPIGGGKGGIGKSFITANLGVLLAKSGKRVALVDLDLGGSNLHTFLGITDIPTGIHNFLDKSMPDLEQAVVPTSLSNLFLISSADCTEEIANLFAAQKTKIIKALFKLPYDYVLLDLGAGTSFNTLDFFLTSNQGIIVCTPEPTSIENAFKFIKAAYLRKAKQILKRPEFREIYKEILCISDETGKQSSNLIEAIMQHDPYRGRQLQQELKGFTFKFIINQFRKTVDATLGEKIEKVCNRHFFSDFTFMGNISFDERVYQSILAKKVFVNKYSYTISAIEMSNITKNIAGNFEERKPRSL